MSVSPDARSRLEQVTFSLLSLVSPFPSPFSRLSFSLSFLSSFFSPLSSLLSPFLSSLSPLTSPLSPLPSAVASTVYSHTFTVTRPHAPHVGIDRTRAVWLV